jgi:hypothetical protein
METPSVDLHRLKPTERRIYDCLIDGQLHLVEELHGCLWDELGPLRNVEAHLTSLRKHLRQDGKTIKCQRLQGRTYYHLVRIFSNPE